MARMAQDGVPGTPGIPCEARLSYGYARRPKARLSYVEARLSSGKIEGKQIVVGKHGNKLGHGTPRS